MAPEPAYSSGDAAGLVGASVVLSSVPQPRNSRPAGSQSSTSIESVGSTRLLRTVSV
jgi:hypothetical protein